MLDEINEIHPLFKNAPTTTEFKKLRKRIIKNTREAIEQYGMIEPGARWLVCMSGGKDSYTLLAALYELKSVSYTHLRAHETPEHLGCPLQL